MARKTKKSKTSRKAPKRKESFVERNRAMINFLLALLLLAAIVSFFAFVKVYIEARPGAVVATVNGHEITERDIEQVYNRLPPYLQELSTDELLLEQLIQELLVMLRARELDLKATDSEVDQVIEEALGSAGISNLGAVLEQQGLSERDFRSMMRNNVIMQKLLELEAYHGVEVTDDEALEYYNNNAEKFVVPEAVAVRHIMILINGSEIEAKGIAQALLKEARASNFENFCDLVLAYSIDGFSREICGRYNVTRNMPVPQGFIDASFALEDGEAGVARTDKGYHVIQRLKDIPEKLIRFDDAKTQIKQLLIQGKQKEAQRLYLIKLKEDAEIENFLMEDFVDEIEGIIEEQEQVVQESISMCLAGNAVLYGASWDSRTKEQFEILDGLAVEYIECAVSDDLDAQSEACTGIDAYPTWVIDGKEHLGVQSIERLQSLSGC